MTKLLAFAGSSRQASFNRLAVAQLARMATEAGAEVTTLDIGELDLPIYNADLEARDGIPAGARRIRTLLREHHGLIVGCPEYNGFVTPLLLNTLDWASRSEEGGFGPAIFAGKTVAISSASPGPFGGVRSSGHLRNFLSSIGCLVMPLALVIPNAGGAFNDDGTFKDERIAQRAGQVVAHLIDITGKLS